METAYRTHGHGAGELNTCQEGPFVPSTGLFPWHLLFLGVVKS